MQQLLESTREFLEEKEIANGAAQLIFQTEQFLAAKDEKPAVDLEHRVEFGKFYEDHEPDPWIVERGQRLSRWILRPKVTYEEGAEDAIQDHLEEDGQILIVANHVLFQDPLTLSAVLRQENAFEKVRLKMAVLTKASLFKKKFLRHLIEGMGSIPVIRKKDIVGDDKDRELSELEEKQMLSSGMKSLKNAAGYVNVKQGNATIFAEGERNKNDASRVQPFLIGAVALAKLTKKSKTEDRPGVFVISSGISYSRFIKRAYVHIGLPIDPADLPKDNDLATNVLHTSVQICVDSARLSSHKPIIPSL